MCRAQVTAAQRTPRGANLYGMAHDSEHPSVAETPIASPFFWVTQTPTSALRHPCVSGSADINKNGLCASTRFSAAGCAKKLRQQVRKGRYVRFRTQTAYDLPPQTRVCRAVSATKLRRPSPKRLDIETDHSSASTRPRGGLFGAFAGVADHPGAHFLNFQISGRGYRASEPTPSVALAKAGREHALSRQSC